MNKPKAIEELQAQVDLEGKRLHIESMIDTMRRNILDTLGGEEGLHPYDRANLNGAFTYLKTYSLKPLEQVHGEKRNHLSSDEVKRVSAAALAGGNFSGR